MGRVVDTSNISRVLNFDVASEISPRLGCQDSTGLRRIPERMTGNNEHSTEVQFNSNSNSTTEGSAMEQERSE